MQLILRLILARYPKKLLTRSRDLEKGKHLMHSIKVILKLQVQVTYQESKQQT